MIFDVFIDTQSKYKNSSTSRTELSRFLQNSVKSTVPIKCDPQ